MFNSFSNNIRYHQYTLDDVIHVVNSMKITDSTYSLLKYTIKPGEILEIPRPKNFETRILLKYLKVRDGIVLTLKLNSNKYTFKSMNVNQDLLQNGYYKFKLSSFLINPNFVPSFLFVFDKKNKLYFQIQTVRQRNNTIDVQYFVLN